MAKVKAELKDGSKRVMVFDARLEKASSGRGVSGLVLIWSGTWNDGLRERVQLLPAGEYKMVLQKRVGTRWVHVDGERVVVRLAPSRPSDVA